MARTPPGGCILWSIPSPTRPVPPESQGEFVETLPAFQALCIFHHGAYEELPAVGRRLLDHANARGLTPLGTLRHTYLEGPPQHKDPSKFITQVILPIAPRPEESEETEGPEE